LKTQIVRISSETHSRLKAMASASGETIGEILAKAVEAYRREMLLNDANRAFARLKEREELWKDEQKEREEWETALADGLDKDE
jgi:predicted DNA-binding protein